MSDAPIPKSYDAKLVEPKWLEYWLEENLFEADVNSKKPPYCIVIPPPNVTGVLHMGHALVNTLQDLLIRWKRMSGFEALWVPGTDHAGIATQTVVERHLLKTEGKRRTDYSREEFLKIVWEWKEKSEGRILNQLKTLGCSCDWSRLRFTMDDRNNRSVRKAFKTLYDQGLIYQGDYLVNWDPVTKTALADDEVEYEERDSFLWYFKYPIKDSDEHIVIATTRPETMLGDTAVAVSLDDDRYKHLIGKTLLLPLVNREIPIIADHRVDAEFGTGALKITPAHDPNDYQMGLDHKLPFVNIMTEDGHINENGGEFFGLSMKKARKQVVEALQKLNLVEKIEPHKNRVGISYRSKATIEPFLSKQWFVKMDGFTKTLREAVEDEKVKILPKGWENVYYHWIDNLRDWCISRQLWWGHRIPIWHKIDGSGEMICYEGEGIPPEVEKNPEMWEQDPDVLDTWFSSALWPFATLGWPEETPELKRFYPNAVLVTGQDILFFWVARMIAMGQHLMKDIPFPETFLNGLIYGKSYWRDNPEGGISYIPEEERIEYDLGKKTPADVKSRWEKMSKSKGNIIDPLELIDLYGADAVRMGLLASCGQSREIDLDRRRFEEFKNFANKIWNGARFVLMNLASEDLPKLSGDVFSEGLNESNLKLEDRWILSMLSKRIESVEKHLGSYQFDQAAMEAYDFFWKEFCAYYVETCKPALFGKTTPEERIQKQKILVIVLDHTLRLLHPMAPYITEELFLTLKETLGVIPKTVSKDPWTQATMSALLSKACTVAPFPKAEVPSDQKALEEFEFISEVLYSVRNIRGEMQLRPSEICDLYIISNGEDPTIQEYEPILRSLVRVGKIEYCKDEPSIGLASTGVCRSLRILIPMPKERIASEKKRLEKEACRLKIAIEKLQNQLANKSFVERAPKELVEKQQNQLKEQREQIETIQKKIHSLNLSK